MVWEPIDGTTLAPMQEYSVEAQPPDPLTREIIDQVLPLGVRAVDGLITIGRGQRIGIFAGSGVGKRVHYLVCLQEIQKQISM